MHHLAMWSRWGLDRLASAGGDCCCHMHHLAVWSPLRLDRLAGVRAAPAATCIIWQYSALTGWRVLECHMHRPALWSPWRLAGWQHLGWQLLLHV